MSLARDKNHDLSLFNELPRRGNECWWAESGADGTDLKLDKALYPEIVRLTSSIFARLEN